MSIVLYCDPQTDMKCDPNSCIDGYYPKVNNMTSCFKGELPKYYLEGGISQKCLPCVKLVKDILII
jgi:hypothetical protein